MLLDYSPNYVEQGFPTHKNYMEDEIYYIGYLDDTNTLQTMGVMIEQLYSETPPMYGDNVHTSWYAKLYTPRIHYKTFLHKWFNSPITEYDFNDKRVCLQFLEKNDMDARITYLNIMAEPNHSMVEAINRVTAEFADEHPDIYIDKMMNYRGLRSSHPPFHSFN